MKNSSIFAAAMSAGLYSLGLPEDHFHSSNTGGYYRPRSKKLKAKKSKSVQKRRKANKAASKQRKGK